jgi:hypothetical protein
MKLSTALPADTIRVRGVSHVFGLAWRVRILDLAGPILELGDPGASDQRIDVRLERAAQW